MKRIALFALLIMFATPAIGSDAFAQAPTPKTQGGHLKGEKKSVKEKKAKKHKKDGVCGWEGKNSIGVRGFITPWNSASADIKGGGSVDTDMNLGYGFGAIYARRIANSPDISILGNFDYLSLKADGATDRDGLMRIGTGVQVTLMGGVKKRSADRVYGKGLVGYASYSDSNDTAKGIYLGAGVGLEHFFSGKLSAFVEGDFLYHNFMSGLPTGVDGMTLTALDVNAGVAYHF
jgi:hypothetical protein